MEAWRKVHSHSVCSLLTCIVLLGGCSGARQLTQAFANSSVLAQGAGFYLESQPEYSLFWEIVQTINATGAVSGPDFTGWFEGPTNETILVVNNDDLRSDFANIAVGYNISDPTTFVDRLIPSANFSTDPHYGNSYPLTTGYAAGVVLLSFIASHDLPQASIQNFYQNVTVLNAFAGQPVNISINGLGDGFDTYDRNLKIYADTVYEYKDGNYSDYNTTTTVYLGFPEGILHFYRGPAALASNVAAAYSSIAVPHAFLQANGTNALGGQNITSSYDSSYSYSNGLGTGPATLTVYEVPGAFVYAEGFGFADTPNYSADASLRYLAEHDF